jgi:hypothetical protein
VEDSLVGRSLEVLTPSIDVCISVLCVRAGYIINLGQPTITTSKFVVEKQPKKHGGQDRMKSMQKVQVQQTRPDRRKILQHMGTYQAMQRKRSHNNYLPMFLLP